MKKKVLFLFPILALSGCGVIKVSYDEYKAKAEEVLRQSVPYTKAETIYKYEDDKEKHEYIFHYVKIEQKDNRVYWEAVEKDLPTDYDDPKLIAHIECDGVTSSSPLDFVENVEGVKMSFYTSPLKVQSEEIINNEMDESEITTYEVDKYTFDDYGCCESFVHERKITVVRNNETTVYKTKITVDVSYS